jgi:type IV secretion system protein VirB8
LLFLLLIASILLVVLSVFKVSNVSSLYTIRPFVIEVEEHSGITNIVNPLANKELISNDALTQYFIMKYIRARESYCDSDWKFNYLTVVRLLSNAVVFSDFRKYVNYDPKSPLLIYGKTTCTSVKLRSIQFFNEKIDPQGEAMKLTAVIRFTVYDANGGKAIKQYKIASLEYKYTQLEMSIEDRDVNPLGFQIVNYKVDPELLVNE